MSGAVAERVSSMALYEVTGGQVVKAFDCGPKCPRIKSHLLLHKVKSFYLPLLPLGDQPMAERAKEVKNKDLCLFDLLKAPTHK